jgi:hypothetical protein
MNNPEIVKFITKKENLQIAMEVTDLIEDLKRQTHRDFWVAMNQELTGLIEKEYPGFWIFRKFNLKHLRKDWETAFFDMIVRNHEKHPTLLRFGIGQSSQENNYRLYCGVFKHGTINPMLMNLRGELVSVNLSNNDDWWAGWGYLPVIPNTTDFIFEMYNNKEEFIKESAKAFWEKLTFLRPEVERINLQLLEALEESGQE